MLQITFYPDKNSPKLTSKNFPIEDQKPSSIIKQWEDDNPAAIFSYSKMIE